MQKMNLPLKDFITLVGPAQILEIVSENYGRNIGQEGKDEDLILFHDKAIKINEKENNELLYREVKHIQPIEKIKSVFRIWVY